MRTQLSTLKNDQRDWFGSVEILYWVYCEAYPFHIQFLTHARTMSRRTDIPGRIFIKRHAVKSLVNEDMRMTTSYNRLTRILLEFQSLWIWGGRVLSLDQGEHPQRRLKGERPSQISCYDTYNGHSPSSQYATREYLWIKNIPVSVDNVRTSVFSSFLFFVPNNACPFPLASTLATLSSLSRLQIAT